MDGFQEKRILIVDDMPTNIRVLAETLKKKYKLSFARNGYKALKMIRQSCPDLILLDIMMPGIDGYEVCRQLKKDDQTKLIPIIFITAKTGNEDESLGLSLGAVDYITKPFSPSIVEARVKTQLELKHHQDHLKELVEQRTQQLVHADRLSAIGTFSAAIIHEILNPNQFISSNAQLLNLFWQSAYPILKNNLQDDESGAFADSVEGVAEKLQDIIEGTEQISGLIRRLKGYARKSENEDEVPVIKAVNYALKLIEFQLKSKNIKLNIQVEPALCIFCEKRKLSQIFVNLFHNACDAIMGDDGEITVIVTRIDNAIRIVVGDNGPGIVENDLNKIFDPFFTTKGQDHGTGLGLFIVKNIIEDYKGTISVRSKISQGTEFIMQFPSPAKINDHNIIQS